MWGSIFKSRPDLSVTISRQFVSHGDGVLVRLATNYRQFIDSEELVMDLGVRAGIPLSAIGRSHLGNPALYKNV